MSIILKMCMMINMQNDGNVGRCLTIRHQRRSAAQPFQACRSAILVVSVRAAQ
jgi:hypothetical protein